MSLKVDEDADADQEDEDDPEDDSFVVFNIGDEEVVVKKGKVKRHTMGKFCNLYFAPACPTGTH
jgi:hypothetical protein